MPLKVAAAGESANDTGRRGNSETAAAALSIFDGGRDCRGRTPQAHRRYHECLDQRVLLSGTFSREACHAGGPYSFGGGVPPRRRAPHINQRYPALAPPPQTLTPHRATPPAPRHTTTLQ